MEAGGHLMARRRRQALDWMHELVGAGLETAFRSHPRVTEALPGFEAAVRTGRTTALRAARELLILFGDRRRPGRPTANL
jgi:LAO/AO transport system kinase